jgi:hypothetical protein
MAKAWSDDETDLLKELYGYQEASDILSQFPGRTKTSIRKKALKMGLGGRYRAPIQRKIPKVHVYGWFDRDFR